MPSQKGGATLLQDLREFKALLKDNLPDSAIVDIPNRPPLSFSQAARGISSIAGDLADGVISAVEDTLLLCEAPSVPILAILGLLNAGKSSLVCSFLTEMNRRRVLIGSANAQGTHRFVLWLPEAWKDNQAIWNHIQSRLDTVFGTSLELLADDPVVASAQYNDTKPRALTGPGGERTISPMESPLIGFDRGLDHWGVALMDCPDVQTGLLPDRNLSLTREGLAAAVESVAQKRLELLAKVSPFCSAFVIVLPANAMHDEKVTRLMHLIKERMPNTPQIAAVNRVPRRYATKDIQLEIAKLYSRERLERVYMAYSFDGPNDRERLPAPPPAWPKDQLTSLPLFFRIDLSPSPQPPIEVPDDRWLLNIGGQLDKSQLLDGSIDSHISRIRSETLSVLQRVKERVIEQTEARESMRQSLSAACLEFSRDPQAPDLLRLQASKQIVDQIARSLERTAPWWAAPGRWVSRISEFGKSQVSNMAQWLRVPEWISGKTEGLIRFIRGKWNSGNDARIVTSDSLIHAIARCDKAGYWQLDRQDEQGVARRSELQRIVQSAMDRFQSESRISLDPKDLDEYSKRMWENMPLRKRLLTGVAPAAVLFAPLIAVLAIPVDFGGSSVLVFASLKELLGAGLAGIGIVLLSSDAMPRIAESEAAWQQFGDLLAVLCDELGLERPSEDKPLSIKLGELNRRVPTSTIPPRAAKELVANSQREALVPPAWNLRTTTVQRIETVLQSLRNHKET